MRPLSHPAHPPSPQLKSHPFFAGLDWDDVFARRYRPEFIPPPNGVAVVAAPEVPEDGAAPSAGPPGVQLVPVVTNFEDEFTRETPVDSVADASKLSTTAVERSHFQGFTYEPAAAALLEEN